MSSAFSRNSQNLKKMVLSTHVTPFRSDGVSFCSVLEAPQDKESVNMQDILHGWTEGEKCVHNTASLDAELLSRPTR